jgi:Family of unknown function (DUF5985)
MMAEAVYLLCALTSAGCAVLLLRRYRQVRARHGGGLLLWSSLCFSGLAVSNAILFVDLVLFPSVDLSLIRAAVGALSSVVLVIGLIWELD